MLREQLEDIIVELKKEVYQADGFEDALIGYTESWSGHSRPPRLVYSKQKVLAKLMLGGMSEEEAYEYFDFNIEGAYVGEGTPIFVDLLE